MSRKKRILRAGLIGLLLLTFVGYFAFATFFFPPIEGGFSSKISGLIPRDVDLYVGRAELRQSFDSFPRLAVAKELEGNPAVETFLESPTWTEIERTNRIEETLAEIETQLEQLPLGLDVLDVIGGEELAVAADFEGKGVAATDWAVYARASFWGKLAVSALKHPGLIGLSSQGLEAARDGDVITLSGAKLERPIHVIRVRDIIVAGTSRRLVDRAPELEVNGSQDSLLLAAPYGDFIMREGRDAEERDFEVQFNVAKLRETQGFSKPLLDPGAEVFGESFLARLLPLPAIRRLIGILDLDEGLSVDLHGELSTELLKADQRSIYRAKSFSREELIQVARFAPADSTLMVYLRGPVGTLLRMGLDALEPAARDNLNAVCTKAGYASVDEVVDILDATMVDRIAFFARPNDWGEEDDMKTDPDTGEQVYVGPPHDDTPVFAWAMVAWMQDEAPINEMRDRFGQAGPQIGLQGRTPGSNGYFKNRIGGGLQVYEYWSQFVPGTGHLAVMAYGENLLISNRYKFIDIMARNAVGQGQSSSRLNGRTDFQYLMQDSVNGASVALWLDAEGAGDLIREQQRVVAENRIKDSINYRVERPKIEREVSRVSFQGRPRSSLSANEADRFDRLVDDQLAGFRRRVVEENLPRELADIDRLITYLGAMTGALAMVKLDQKEFDISLRLMTPYEGR